MNIFERLNQTDITQIRKFGAVLRRNFFDKLNPLGIEVDLANPDNGKILIQGKNHIELYSFVAKESNDQYSVVSMDISKEIFHFDSILGIELKYSNAVYGAELKAEQAILKLKDKEIAIKPYANLDYCMFVDADDHITGDFKDILSNIEAVVTEKV